MSEDNDKYWHHDLNHSWSSTVGQDDPMMLAEIRKMDDPTPKFNRRVYGGEALSKELAEIRKKIFGEEDS